MSSLEERRARGALGHLRIADFSRVLAGPLATMVLGDLGADQFAIYLMHDQQDETLDAYGRHIMPVLSGN